MQYRTLGRTDLEVSEIGFGAWGIGRGFWKDGDDAAAIAALESAADAGINFFDTALGYGRGHSERLIGALLRRRRQRLLVATKIPPLNYRWPGAGPIAEAFPRSHIEASVESSRRNLGVETLDLVQLHVWNPDWADEPEWSDTLDELRHQGVLRHVGVSGNDHDPDSLLPLIRSGRVDTVQVIYNIFDPAAAGRLFPACLDANVGVLVRVPLDEGGLSGKINAGTRFPSGDWRNHYFTPERRVELEKRVEALKGLLGGEVENLPEMALRFCLQPRAVSTVLVGMRRPAHVVANVAASGCSPLSDELMAALAGHAWPRNFYVS